MKKYKNLRFFPVFFAVIINAALTIGCEAFVDAGVPESQLSGAVVFEDVATARAALGNSYTLLRDNAMVTGTMNGLSILLGNYADEFVPYGALQPEQAFFQNNLTPANDNIALVWNESYKVIYSLNAVIEGVTASQGIPESDRDVLIGEALLLRSLVYFHLVNLFGEIPYVESTDYRVNISVPKSPVAEVYARLIRDLTAAYEKLPEQYRTPLRTTPNKSVAAALLARVYLYMENWQLAFESAGKVINTTDLYTIETDPKAVFLKGSRSTLWQLSPGIEGAPTHEGQNFIFTAGPPPNRAIDYTLVDSFEPGDLRRELWIGSVTDGTDTWYYPHKYRQYSASSVSDEYSIVLRLEEMYLIRAEALAHLGDTGDALDDINAIRNRAGLPDALAGNMQELLDAIIKERRSELFTEQGHRWFDLRRTGRADSVLLLSKPGWAATDLLWPLPQNELRLNPSLLPQNPGY